MWPWERTRSELRNRPLNDALMSALGQKQTCAAQNVMSALPQKRTFDGRGSAEATLYFSSKTFSMSRYKGRASAKAVLTFAGLPPMRAIVCGAAFQIENN